MENHVLPDLPYDYAALEPYISGEIMELHHDKHHDTYVKGINTAVEQLAEARAVESFGSLSTLEKNLAFHLGGHVNHSVFWSQVAGRGDKPAGDLAAASDELFGSFHKVRAHFEANALGVQGSGWSVLTWTCSLNGCLSSCSSTTNLFGPAAHARHVGARRLPAVQERPSPPSSSSGGTSSTGPTSPSATSGQGPRPPGSP